MSDDQGNDPRGRFIEHARAFLAALHDVSGAAECLIDSWPLGDTDVSRADISRLSSAAAAVACTYDALMSDQSDARRAARLNSASESSDQFLPIDGLAHYLRSTRTTICGCVEIIVTHHQPGARNDSVTAMLRRFPAPILRAQRYLNSLPASRFLARRAGDRRA